MPEVRFMVNWPDGSNRVCYSPSTVIHDYLTAEEALPVSEFLTRATAGLDAASTRVAKLYGRPCAIAEREAREIATAARRQPPDGTVTIEFLR
ncbi:MAG: MSMEG_0570 family nitrogen starvation response protein [Rhizobiaceae bacterium]|nr:MSMEG_0570 family nitrogen starvation response protein [Rhizobiaceae bacterium]